MAGTDFKDNRITEFWVHNVPRIGLSHHFVLHLAFAVAGYHLASLTAGEESRQRYLLLAERHFSAGLARFTKALLNCNANDCGALYTSAVLVCYSTFAAGPLSSDDLLVCNVNHANPVRLLPLIQGLQVIRETVPPDTLFSELMAPPSPLVDDPNPVSSPTFSREGFPRIDWEEPLRELRCLITSSASLDVDTCLHAFDHLSAIYEATYGKSDGSYEGPAENRFVFGWLYRMETKFVACLQRKEPLALLILTYYAVFFGTMRDCWFMDGWSHHLIPRLRDFLGRDFARWLRWPIYQVGLEWSEGNG